MTISDDYENKLNRMNRASQNVSLGTLLKQVDNVINSGSPIEELNIISNSTDTPITFIQNGSGSVIKIGSENDYLSITNYGEIRLTGSAIVWDDLRFPASAINPPGGIGGAAVDTVDTPFIGTLLFDPASVEICVGQAQMPHGWKEGSYLSPHVHWSPISTSTGSVVWRLSCETANVGEAYNGSYTYISEVASYSDGTLNDHILSDFSDLDMTGKTISNMTLWRISRMATSGSDTYPQDARLLEFDIHYQIDSLGSNAEYLKNG